MTSSPVFAQERLQWIWKEVQPLLSQHWAEIARPDLDAELDPDDAAYFAAEERGLIRVFTARVEGVLVGYASYLITHDLHSRKVVQAHEDVIFIQKDRRGFGAEFIRWCDERLREERVQMIFYHINPRHDFSPMLANAGYHLSDLVYSRRFF